jgi:atypical dual specificity phosphatase
MVSNFRFEEEGRIALSGFPKSPEEVDWLHDQGVRTVVSLHAIPEEVQVRLRERGIEWRPFLISDWSEGTPPGMEALFDAVEKRAERDPVLIHCQGGGGRAGTFYAAYLVSRGLTPQQAITRVPGVEKDAQKAFLHGFASGLNAGRVSTRRR